MSRRAPVDDPAAILHRHRRIWHEKPVLREVYAGWYRRIAAHLPRSAERVLEIGGGSGNLKAALPQVITSDLVSCEWLDLVCDAQHLSFARGSLDGVVMVDVLHHLPCPTAFFEEVAAALRPGGRLVIFDVYLSPFSRLVMKLVHPEPVDLSARVFDECRGEVDRHPWDSNQAIATLLFWRHLDQFQERFKELPVIHREISDFFLYPLSGGFEFVSLLPGWAAPLAGKLEKLGVHLAKFLAFRGLVVLERRLPEN